MGLGPPQNDYSKCGPILGVNADAILEYFIGEIVFAQHVDMGPGNRGMGGYDFKM